MPFSEAELVERRKFLGGSEAAAAIGLSDWYTPYQLWLSKQGKGEPIEETLPMMVGTALEDVVLRLFEKESGLTVTDKQKVITDQAWPVRRATLDGRASDTGNIQAKCSGLWKEWGTDDDAVPQYVIFQTHHEMACNGATHTWVPMIMSQREFRIYRVDRDNELIEMLTKGEKAFWNFVTTLQSPPPINFDDIKILYPYDIGTELVASVELSKIAVQLAALKKDIKKLEETEKLLEFNVKSALKDHAALVDGKTRKPLFTYKSHTERRVDVTSLRKDHPSIAEQYSPEKTVRKLLCKI